MNAAAQGLLDGDVDRRLRRDGFVVVPVVAPEVAERWRQRLEVRRTDDHLDDELVEAVERATSGGVVDEGVELLEPGHHEGSDPGRGLGTDAAGSSALGVWLALDDVTGHNGQVRVLRGSHRIGGSVSRAEPPAWLRHRDVIESRLLSVPLRAGEALVFQPGLVRCRYPNLTERPTLAAEFTVRTPAPVGVDPSAPAAIDDAAHDHSAHELATLLDRGVVARLDRLQQTTRRSASGVAGAVSRTAGRARSRSKAVADGLAERRRRLADAPSPREAVTARVRQLPSRAAMAVLRLNEAYILRFGPDTPVVWDHHEFEWSYRVEAAWPEILEEVRALLDGSTDIPHIEDVTGGIPQGNIGPWRSFVMMHQGNWIDWNCERCPRTTEIVRSIPNLTVAGFSVLEPGTHITTHRGPNKGALRYQLGVIVPGKEGDCRIRVGDEMLVWRDGEGVMFDFTIPHEAWNDSDGIRVLLMLELLTPLPWYIDRPNRVAQRAMGWFPTTRDLTNRLRKLEPSLRRVAG